MTCAGVLHAMRRRIQPAARDSARWMNETHDRSRAIDWRHNYLGHWISAASIRQYHDCPEKTPSKYPVYSWTFGRAVPEYTPRRGSLIEKIGNWQRRYASTYSHRFNLWLYILEVDVLEK